MIPLIDEHLEEIAALCREFGVARLEVFGSAATGAFDPARSDIDFIVEYAPETDLGPWLSRYFDFEERLETLLGRSVDLIMAGAPALDNRWFRREADKTRTVIHDPAQVSEVA